MIRRALVLAFLLSTPLFAQLRRGDWTTYPAEGCIGGSQCRERSLRVRLEDRPIVAVRFKASDEIGNTAGGELRVRIDRNVVASNLDIPRKGQTFTLDVDELRGQYLVFEPDANDEVQVGEIAVMYGRDDDRRDDDRHYGQRPPSYGGNGSNGPRGGGWRSYQDHGCIGGTQCRQNGTRLTILLEDRPVLGIRFNAQDNIGARADGKIGVRIDNNTVASYVDVHRDGSRLEFEVDAIRGSRLIISADNDDEVEVSNIEVLYGRRGDYDSSDRGRYPSELRDDGGCIGGSDCGGRRARIRIALHGRPVESIRFYAHDNVGAKAGGELRIRVDDVVLRDYLDIAREGKTYTIDGKGASGDYLYIEPSEDDEVVIKDVRVKFEE